jgi:hypothetical protein
VKTITEIACEDLAERCHRLGRRGIAKVTVAEDEAGLTGIGTHAELVKVGYQQTAPGGATDDTAGINSPDRRDPPERTH